MPNLKSAAKHMVADKKKHDRNVSIKSKVKTSIKKVLDAIETQDLELAQKLYSEAVSTMDKATKYGVLKDNTMSRRKSRIAKKLNDLRPQ